MGRVESSDVVSARRRVVSLHQRKAGADRRVLKRQNAWSGRAGAHKQIRKERLGTPKRLKHEDVRDRALERARESIVCLLLQDLLQSCAGWGKRIVEDMCYEIRRAEAGVD